MKKCPECGNPSYDGAPVCGNCGYNFPKPKGVAPKSEDIFQSEPKVEKKSNDEDTVSILKQNKLLIGIIILITLIVICGIVLTSSGNNGGNSNPVIQSSDAQEFNAGNLKFKYPNTWKEINQTDDEHPGAVFFQNEDNVTIEYYNVTSDAQSLKEITQQRVGYTQNTGEFVELVETITIDGRNASNVILETADGNYARFVSLLSDGELYVFKITGNSVNSITSESIENSISSSDIA